MSSQPFRRIAALTALVAGLIAAPAQAAVTRPLAADFSDAAFFLSGNFNNIGWSFSVTAGITIDGLGLFDYGADGLTNRHEIGLWDSSNHLIAQATIFDNATAIASASPAGQWLFVNIAPLTLDVGDYVIGALYADNDLDAIGAIATGFDLDEHFSYGESRASDGASLERPASYGLVQPGIFGPNLHLLPEPGTAGLLGLALAAGLAARRRRG